MSRIQSQRHQHTLRHQLVALDGHVDSIARQNFLSRFVLGLDSLLKHRIQIRQTQLLLPGQRPQVIVVRGQLRVLRVVQLLVDYCRGQQHYLDSGRLCSLHDRGDVLLVSAPGCSTRPIIASGQRCIIEGHAVLPVPHIVHAAAQRHPLWLLGNHIALQPRQHVVGLVPADASRHGHSLDAIRFQPRHHQAHISHGIAPSAFRNRVAEKSDLLPALDRDLRRGGLDKGESNNSRRSEPQHRTMMRKMFGHRVIDRDLIFDPAHFRAKGSCVGFI